MSWAIWITGLPGSGKTTLARSAAAALAARGVPVKVLELDEIRRTVTPRPTCSDAERDVLYRALACMAQLLVEAGVRVLIDATGHRRAWRELARDLIPLFAEVQLGCPPEVCRARAASHRGGCAAGTVDAQSGRPGATVPGVDVPYETSPRAELDLDTHQRDLATQVQEILYVARRLERQARSGSRRSPRRLACKSKTG